MNSLEEYTAELEQEVLFMMRRMSPYILKTYETYIPIICRLIKESKDGETNTRD